MFLGLIFEGSFLFLFVLLLIFASIWGYSWFYLSAYYLLGYYKVLMLWFLISMVGLLFSKSGFMFLFSWDMLGLSSFFLVLLYLNWDSFSGSMITVMVNRLGDYVLLVFFLVSSGMDFFTIMGVFSVGFCFLAACTKSAQWPFMSWLPKAMSAPTPVSALVHSSTLVTAGVLLVFVFSEKFSYRLLSWIFYLGYTSLVLSSILASYEKDLKKMVALSTLSQIGLCFLMGGLQYWFISFLHLLSHALYKSLLFLQVGNLIYTIWGEQEGRSYNSKSESLVGLQLLVSLSGLCGLFFSGGLLTKDFLVEAFFYSDMAFFLFLCFFLSLVLTLFYIFKLMVVLVSSKGSSTLLNMVSGSFLLTSGFLYLTTLFYLWWVGANLMVLSSWTLGQASFIPLLFSLFFLLMGLLVVFTPFSLEYYSKGALRVSKNFSFFENLGLTFFSLPINLMSCLKVYLAWVLVSSYLFYMALVIFLFLL